MQRVQRFTYAAGLAAAFTVASAGLAAQTPAAKQQPAAATEMSSEDSTFVQKAAEAGRMEVEHGKMAAAKASSAQVKSFANKLVKDHTAANNQLKSIAQKKNIGMPAETQGLAGRDEAWMSQTGTAFDKGYIDAQVKAHEDAIALFEKQASSGSDVQLKAFASKQLPGLRAHLKQAQDLQSKLGASTPK